MADKFTVITTEDGSYVVPNESAPHQSSSSGGGGGGNTVEINIEVEPEAVVEAAGEVAGTASEMAYNFAAAALEMAAQCV